MKLEIPDGARRILQTLNSAGYESYLVGGSVRDLLRGVKPHDWDICTSALPEETEQCFAGQRFQEDGLRVIRALRFAAVFGYEIEEQTAQAVHENRTMLDRVAAERINAELCKLLVGKNAGDVLRQYPDVFCQFWPQLDPVVSAQLADQVLRALKFDNKTRERVVLLLERHDAQLPPRSQVIRRWLGRLRPEAFFQLLEVKRADSMGQTPEKVQDRLAELGEIKAKAEQILAERQCLTLKDLAVNGRDVIAAGIEPGPEVGRELNELLEKVVSEEIPNRQNILLDLMISKEL